jgi:hypothetical protein
MEIFDYLLKGRPVPILGRFEKGHRRIWLSLPDSSYGAGMRLKPESKGWFRLPRDPQKSRFLSISM